MAIKTARYGNRNLNDEEHYPVGISLGRPRYKTKYTIREQCYVLAPRRDMLHMDAAEYEDNYFEKLERTGASKIMRMVQQLDAQARAEGKDLVLLCFEDIRKPDQWCHRRLFADWWMEKTGEIVEELEEAGSQKKLATQQAKEEPAYEQISFDG